MTNNFLELVPLPDAELPLLAMPEPLHQNLHQNMSQPSRDDACSICQAPVQALDHNPYVARPCWRFFHGECLDRAVRDQETLECPVCGRKLKWPNENDYYEEASGPEDEESVPQEDAIPSPPDTNPDVDQPSEHEDEDPTHPAASVPSPPTTEQTEDETSSNNSLDSWLGDFAWPWQDRWVDDDTYENFPAPSHNTQKHKYLMDKSLEERVKIQLRYLGSLTEPEPFSWYIARDEEAVNTTYGFEDKYAVDVKNELKLCLEVLEIHPTTSTVRRILSEEMMREWASREVWEYTRVYGVSEWFSFWFVNNDKWWQTIGFWMPYPQRIVPLRTELRLRQHLSSPTYIDFVAHGLPTDLIQIPLPTQLLIDQLQLRTGSTEGDSRSGLIELQNIAGTSYRNTHWALVKAKNRRGSSVLYAVLWPINALKTGLEELRYPGWCRRRSMIHYEGGWNKDVADKFLENFLTERRDAIRQLQHQNSELNQANNRKESGQETEEEERPANVGRASQDEPLGWQPETAGS